MTQFRIILLLCGLHSLLSAQTDPSFYSFPNNHLPWFSIESEHFTVHYQEGNQRSARVIATVAEDVYKPITSLYGHEPDTKVAIVLKDREDYSNGAAYFFDNKIDIWVPALDTPLRGTHHWLRNVIAHEFTHIVQIQAAMKRNRGIPAFYVQWLSYEKVRRPDVLYGFPNGIATIPFASVSVPAWLAEGTAQYQRASLHYETWDAHRDMILRQRTLDKSIMSLDEMGSFAGKNSLERETVYNHGYAFSIWLANRYGEKVLNDISRALAQPGVFDVADAIGIATGIHGDSLHAKWVADLSARYAPVSSLESTTSIQTIEADGFFNFSPRISPGETYLGYVSNRTRDFSRVSLYFRNLKTGELVEIKQVNAEAAAGTAPLLACSYHAAPVVNLMGGAFDFFPDGKRIVFSRVVQNRKGELYSDLFVQNLAIKKPAKALTRSKRLADPSVRPDGIEIAAIQTNDGTNNLVLVDTETGKIRQITLFKDGEQLFTPAWNADGTTLLFAYARDNHRSIYSLNPENGALLPWLESDSIDFRDPVFTPAGDSVMYSSNRGGIFNLYKKPLNGGPEQLLTSVAGGAFQPSTNRNGTIYFAHFTTGGYKIAALSPQNGQLQIPKFSPVLKTADQIFESLNHFADTLETLLVHPKPTPGDTIRIPFNLNGAAGNYQAELSRYKPAFTRTSVFPVVRFDNYSRLNGGNASLLKAGNFGDLGGNLTRDIKTGLYFASRDVRDRTTMFGGLMFGPGSVPVAEGIASAARPTRLASLDRDLFLIFENQGLPFLEGALNPTVSLELYNLRRNVDNGLQIEDFACTACLPDTLGVDIAYEVWQADIFLRSKLNLYSLIELGFSHSPYKVITGEFFSKEYKQVIPEGASRYFIGSTFSAAYIFRVDIPSAAGDVVPAGSRGLFRAAWQPARLLSGYNIKGGVLVPVYDEARNLSVEMQYRQGWATNRAGASIRGRIFSYLNSNSEYFYLDYIGGFTGMRSYPFFAIGGNRTAFAEASGYVPLWGKLNRQAGRFTINSIWLRGFLEAGNGWGGPLDIGPGLKTGAGTELRVNMNSYYLFPTKFFVTTAYGFNRFDLRLPSGFVGSDGGRTAFGGELLVYFGVLFDFEL